MENPMNNPELKEGDLTKKIEDCTARVPSKFYLCTALTIAVASCNNAETKTEETADSLSNVVDSTTENVADSLENVADSVRATGDSIADSLKNVQ
jgi:hypothetical protein